MCECEGRCVFGGVAKKMGWRRRRWLIMRVTCYVFPHFFLGWVILRYNVVVPKRGLLQCILHAPPSLD